MTGRRSELEINTRTLDGGVLAVAPSGELDLGSVGTLSDVLRAAQSRGEAVQLELAELSFIDSTGLAMLLEMSQEAKADGWMLRLVDPSPAVARVVAMTRTQQALGLDSDAG